VARHQVRPAWARDRRVRRPLAVARPQAHAGRGGGRAVAVQRGADDRRQRGALRRAHALLRRRCRRDRHRRLVPGRLSRACLPPGGALHRPRVRAAPLGPGVRARVRRDLVAVALDARPAGARRAGRARDRGGRGALRRRPRRPADRGLPRPHDVRVLVPAAAPAGVAAARHPADGVGAAARAARRHRAVGAHARGVGLALRGRALGGRLVRDRAAGRPVRPARGRLPALRPRRRLGVLAGRRHRAGARRSRCA
jgi:hypothetical protein